LPRTRRTTGCFFGSGSGEHHDFASRLSQGDHGLLELVGELVDVAAGDDQVVAAPADRDEVGPHALHDGDLLGDDLPQHLAAQSQVRVLEAGVPGGERRRQPVRPAHI
jgi:hypothetical protein